MAAFSRRFDIKLDQSLIEERRLQEIFTHGTIRKLELKSENHQWEQTGNIFVEYESHGRPSGIACTEADLWVHALHKGEIVPQVYLAFPRIRLLELARDCYRRGLRRIGGDDGKAKGVIIPIKEILR